MKDDDVFLAMDDAKVDRLLAGERVELTYRHWYAMMKLDIGSVHGIVRRSNSFRSDVTDAVARIVAHRREQIGKGTKRPQFNHVFTFELVSK